MLHHEQSHPFAPPDGAGVSSQLPLVTRAGATQERTEPAKTKIMVRVPLSLANVPMLELLKMALGE